MLYCEDDGDDDNTEIIINIGNNINITIVQDFMSGEHGFSGLVFPQSINLAKFLINFNYIKNIKNIIELGAGCGLPSIASSLSGALNVISTDLSMSIEHLQSNINKYDNTNTEELRWGNIKRINELKNKYCKNENNQYGFDIVIGSDIIYDRITAPLLFKSIDNLTHNNSIILLCGIAGPSSDLDDDIKCSSDIINCFRDLLKLYNYHATIVKYGEIDEEKQQQQQNNNNNNNIPSIDMMCRCVWMLCKSTHENETYNETYERIIKNVLNDEKQAIYHL